MARTDSLPMPEYGHQLLVTDADWPTASDEEQPFGWPGAVAVTGQKRSSRQRPSKQPLAHCWNVNQTLSGGSQ